MGTTVSVSEDYTVADGVGLVLVTVSGIIGTTTITLPANRVDRFRITIKRNGSNLLRTLVVNGNGKNIDGSGTYTFTAIRQAITLEYSDAAGEWIIISNS